MQSAINISKIMFYNKFSAFHICMHRMQQKKTPWQTFAFKFQKFMAQVQAKQQHAGKIKIKKKTRAACA